ncbi:sodium/phosphate symporter [Thermosipho africanus H17ap60334]|uniref:Phosphate transporter n=1 Tax=Thermosipho africanus (strain TCF52B) TaxID=484019 RepID=B7IF57_THEAB|nr:MULTISPECIES: inorganic phosphate transporter [Thermosipho]ACJ74721.1 sodium/phosphate symporter [Thermosipho africanus TCF52B]EKF48863.1 sodium/phosphate symporter [Thermosipho africanus H17ap60334]MBZ4649829.1 sodium/phosphate symporter [Thermosipho sp. (in: thermotogales)]MDK2839611.1 inorganic phosphate transporter, PiT family [Thermosipho sp. (in: thermotogales)]
MLLIVGAFLVGFGMAFAIGANDVANSMATAVGAKAITPKQAVLIASILEFLGAILFGAHVTKTIAKGIVDLNMISDPNNILIGAFSALIASTIWILLATFWGMPVSTTHSIVGGMIGFGLAAGGLQIVNWMTLLKIVITWVTSPLIGGAMAYVIFKFISFSILHRKHPAKAAKYVAPILLGVAFYTIAVLFVVKTMKKDILLGNYAGIIIGFIVFLISFLYLRKAKVGDNEYDIVEKIFKKAQVVTSCYVSFSHGANDVANAVGPLALMYIIITTGSVKGAIEIPKYILALGGIGISFGVAILGYRVMKTVGQDITELNNTRGFSIDFSTATTVLIASTMGMPISTTHTVVGAVSGVGFARGIEVVNVGILKNIIISWFVTVPFAAGVSALLYIILT